MVNYIQIVCDEHLPSAEHIVCCYFVPEDVVNSLGLYPNIHNAHNRGFNMIKYDPKPGGYDPGAFDRRFAIAGTPYLEQPPKKDYFQIRHLVEHACKCEPSITGRVPDDGVVVKSVFCDLYHVYQHGLTT